MTPQRAKELLPVITAFANGETIECSASNWKSKEEIGPEGTANFHDNVQYRIKPKPVTRPWTRDEVPVGAVLKEKCSGDRWLITAAVEDGLRIAGGTHSSKLTFHEVMDRWTLADGSPCTVTEESK